MTSIPTTPHTFADFALPRALLDTLDRAGFVNPTPIQAQALPPALEGKDVVGCAQTGTGKTAAFSLPMLTRLALPEFANSGALVLAPTRELAMQIYSVVEGFGKDLNMRGALLIGGDSFQKQLQQLRRGCRFVIATPGRLVDHLEQRSLTLQPTSIFVLDEFDRMLDMGFAPQLDVIVKALPKKRQTLLFSATMAPELANKVKTFVNDPVRISIGELGKKVDAVREKNLPVTQVEKSNQLFAELEAVGKTGRTLIFTRTQQRVDRVAQALEREGYMVARLHGGRSMSQRVQAMRVFKKGIVSILVATDIAGRGLDVDDIQTVINYDLPATREDYVHRVGRTGRYGREGLAINFCMPEERSLLRRLAIQGAGLPPQTAQRPTAASTRPQGGSHRPVSAHKPRVFSRPR